MAAKKSPSSPSKVSQKSSGEKEKIIIKAEKREKLGKATRKLRKEGILPANIFGKDIDSISIKVSALDFRHTFARVHETGVVYVEVEGKLIPSLIQNIQRHPVSGAVLHGDFKKINLKQKTQAEVPIKIIGESDAVKSKNGILITQMQTMTIEALPTDIPSDIEIDISVLKEIGDEIKIKDIKTTDKVAYKDEEEAVIVSVIAHKEEETEPDTTAEKPEIETEEKKDKEDEKEEKENKEETKKEPEK